MLYFRCVRSSWRRRSETKPSRKSARLNKTGRDARFSACSLRVILLYMCPHINIYVSLWYYAYYYMFVLILTAWTYCLKKGKGPPPKVASLFFFLKREGLRNTLEKEKEVSSLLQRWLAFFFLWKEKDYTFLIVICNTLFFLTKKKRWLVFIQACSVFFFL